MEKDKSNYKVINKKNKQELKISVHIPFYLAKNNKNKLKLLYKVCNSYLKLSKKTKIFVHSNNKITNKNKNIRTPHIGKVILEEGVEIGSNSTIDRGSISDTIIGKNTFLDNQVHIAHNVKIGKGCILAAGFAIAGSSEVGDFCTFSGQVGVAPHLRIGDRSIVAAKSGITKSLKGDKVYAGFPAREIKEHNRRLAMVNDIEKLRDKLIKINRDD